MKLILLNLDKKRKSRRQPYQGKPSSDPGEGCTRIAYRWKQLVSLWVPAAEVGEPQVSLFPGSGICVPGGVQLVQCESHTQFLAMGRQVLLADKIWR